MLQGKSDCDIGTQGMALTLRYFTCRGRGLALRFFLADKGFDFIDEQVPTGPGPWQTIKPKSGLFGTLPLLIIPGPERIIINETLAIAAIVSKLPQAGDLSVAAWAKSLEVRLTPCDLAMLSRLFLLLHSVRT